MKGETLFAVVRNESKAEMQSVAAQEEDKRRAAIQYIERYASIGQLRIVENMPEFAVWKAWKSGTGERLCCVNLIAKIHIGKAN